LRNLLRLPLVDEAAIKEFVRDLQRALLQADVNVDLVLQLSSRIQKRAIDEALPPGVSRREHVIKVLYEELAKFLGEEPSKTSIQKGKMFVIMLVGIQGSGKTTSAVKIAKFYQKRGLKTGLVCVDTFRPGAFEQMKQLADRIEVPVYGESAEKTPRKIAEDGLEYFRKERFDVVIVDTAGRHRNEKDLMEEMRQLAEALHPDEIVLTVDGTIGQQAMTQAKAFAEATSLGSILVTKLDGSARGGGALSAVAATGAKIKFIGAGERIDDLEEFVPSVFVGRLLGMGDIKGLVEKVEEAETGVSKEKARVFLEGRFSLKDMFDQMETLRKMGPLKKVFRMLPGSFNIPEDALDTAEQKLDAWRVIIQSMTQEEVQESTVVDSSRARRIARGSGRSEKEVKELVSQYSNMKKMMKMMRRRQHVMFRKGMFPMKS
jgi:signal recognition particle subunit SRP54